MTNIPTLEELLSMEVTEAYDKTPVPEGDYTAVITGCEVRKGKKGPYLAVEATVHDEDIPEHDRKVWRNSSFSEKAMGMPGGIANLVQSAKPALPSGTDAAALPAAIATSIVSCPVLIEVEHEQVVRNGIPAVNADGTPEIRGQIRQFSVPSDEFIAAIEAIASGQDDDLPF